MRVAFLIDGSFFLKQYRQLKGKGTPQDVAKALHEMCLTHLAGKSRRRNAAARAELYRIFYYDCPPLGKKVHDPIAKQPINFAETASTWSWCWLFSADCWP